MGTFSIWHWIVVLIIVVLIFGTKKLRNLGKDLGSGIKGFKEGIKDANTENDTSNDSGAGSLSFDNDQEDTTNTFKETAQHNTTESNEEKSDSASNKNP